MENYLLLQMVIIGNAFPHFAGLGKGSKFTLILPTVPSPENSPDLKPQKFKNRVSCQVLMVEDNKPTLLVMNRFLKKMGLKNRVITC
jgi:hypothetical protein